MFKSFSFLSIVSTLAILTSSVNSQSQDPPVTVWGLAGLAVTTPGRFCSMTNGAFGIVQEEGNAVIYTAEGEVLWATNFDGGLLNPEGLICPQDGTCEFIFQTDGNLVAYFDSIPLWNSETEGRGAWLVCQEVAPYLYITDAAGNIIWTAVEMSSGERRI